MHAISTRVISTAPLKIIRPSIDDLEIKLCKRDSDMNLIPQELHQKWFETDEVFFLYNFLIKKVIEFIFIVADGRVLTQLLINK